jgi:hypothetical protein
MVEPPDRRRRCTGLAHVLTAAAPVVELPIAGDAASTWRAVLTAAAPVVELGRTELVRGADGLGAGDRQLQVRG